MSRTNTLSVKLVGSDADGGDVILDDLREFCSAFANCLRICERAADLDGPLDYRMVGLRRGSCGITVKPVGRLKPTDRGTDVLDLFNRTVRALEKGGRVDDRINSHDLKEFRRLARPFNHRVRSIQFGRFHITNRFTENIDKVLEKPTFAEGEATGLLERLDVHGKTTFTLFPVVGGPILCQFKEKLLAKVQKGIKKNVTVYGRLSYFSGSNFPGRAKVTDIDIHPNDDELPRLSDLHGLLADDGDDRSAVDIVRSIRDGA